MSNILEFFENFSLKSRHHSKLINFLLPELKKISKVNILEFGVSEKAMSTELFLKHSELNQCKVFSIDNIDYKSKFNNQNWEFILSRDDNFEFLKSKLPNKFNLILLDTIHEANHVEKIFYHYYDCLEINCYFFIDDTSWIPYAKGSEKDRFYGEINNQETFETLLEIYYANRDNFEIEFTFQGTGMCKILKKNNNKLNKKIKIKSRKNSFKNIIRKFLKN